MASKTIVEYVDDLDGSEAAGTVPFGLDGTNYEIDLSEANREQLLKALEPFVKAARRVGGRRRGELAPGRLDRPGGQKRADLDAIRAWARQRGHHVSDRGRIPEQIVRAYDQQLG